MDARLGGNVERVDAREKIAGTAEYVADAKFPGELWAKIVRSERPRARIVSVSAPAVPEGCVLVDGKDLPAMNRAHVIEDDQPVFAEDVVSYRGEAILLVAGPDKATVLEIASAVRVAYDCLPAAFTIAEACSPSAPLIGGIGNRFADYAFERGDPDAAFSGGAAVFEDEAETGYQEHAYLEPQGLVAYMEGGRLVVYGSMQCPYFIKNALVRATGFPPDRVRIRQAATGGGFGGKEEYPSLLACQAAAAAIKTGKPVRLILDRAEDIECTTKRHPSLIRYRTAVDRNGRITAMDIDVKLNAGAYMGLSGVVLQRTMFTAPGPYRVPNLRVRGAAIATNTVPTGAFRGFGAPQALFALELHMDHIASSLGVDPLEFRLRNAAAQGDTTATGGTYAFPVPLGKLAETVTTASGYREKRARYSDGPAATKRREPLRGIGLSLFLHGCGFTGSGERDHIKAEASLVRRKDDSVEILAAAVDMGQGVLTTFRKIAAAALGLPLERITFAPVDTDRVPDSGPTVASRSVMIVGKLVEEAALEMRARWNEDGELTVKKNYRHPDRISWDDAAFRGDAYPTHSWGATVAEVEIDPITYEIAVKGVWASFDVGGAIDERILRGQIEGGILQGLGYATIEVMEQAQGTLLQRSLTDYLIPTSKDAPPVTGFLVDNPYPEGPFGAKGAGELPFVGAAPALASAVENALGIRVDRIPLTPEYLFARAGHAR